MSQFLKNILWNIFHAYVEMNDMSIICAEDIIILIDLLFVIGIDLSAYCKI